MTYYLEKPFAAQQLPRPGDRRVASVCPDHEPRERGLSEENPLREKYPLVRLAASTSKYHVHSQLAYDALVMRELEPEPHAEGQQRQMPPRPAAFPAGRLRARLPQRPRLGAVLQGAKCDRRASRRAWSPFRTGGSASPVRGGACPGPDERVHERFLLEQRVLRLPVRSREVRRGCEVQNDPLRHGRSTRSAAWGATRAP